MLSRRRGKKAVDPDGAKRAAWVSPRLRPCCAKRSGPKISERFGRSSGPREGSRMLTTAAGASSTSRSRSGAAIAGSDDERAHPEDDCDDDQRRHEARCEETGQGIGSATQAEHSPARAVAAVDVRAQSGEIHRRGFGSAVDRRGGPERPVAGDRNGVAGRLGSQFAEMESGHSEDHRNRAPDGLSARRTGRCRISPI